MDIGSMLQEVILLHSQQKFKEAQIVCKKILSYDPNEPNANHFFGVLASETGNLEVAEQYIKKAIEINPDNTSCYVNMGNLVQKKGDIKGSVQWFKNALVCDDSNKKAYNNLGVTFTKLRRYKEALDVLKQAIELDDNYYEAHNNIAEVWRFCNEYDKALKFYDKALSIKPDFVEARWNRALLFLVQKEFEKGWAEYEYRWKRASTPQRSIISGRLWDGKPFVGKTLFVYEEQGLGDTIQFIRYLPLVKKLGGHVIFEVLTPMIRLLETFEGFDRLWVGIKNVDTRTTDRFDFHIPLLSLPKIFNTLFETIPANIPYINADKNLVEIWGQRIKDKQGFKIGIVWSGHQYHVNDDNRSICLSAFLPLKSLKGIKLYSLQKEKHEKWTDIDPKSFFNQDLGTQISDFADTAAIIENLDLVISIDTAIVHLAGAMGKQVWTLLPFAPDWRWMLDTKDSPWYPTMTLFRQIEPCDWDFVVKKVKEELVKEVLSIK